MIITNYHHIPVLNQEIMTFIPIEEKEIYVDCTLGRGGHAWSLLQKIPPSSTLIGFDQDQEAITFCKQKFKDFSNLDIIKSNFVAIDQHVKQKAMAIIMDLGVSSPQLDDKTRGFSYHQDNDLDMRMDLKNPLNAQKILNSYSQKQLKSIFWEYGEEKFASLIAKKIVNARKTQKIITTQQLVSIIKNCVPWKYKKIKHPAKKVFQALRIEVNNELDVLRQALIKASKLLKTQGVLLVITFHSLEDRIVKRFFAKLTTPFKSARELPIIDSDKTNFELISKKVIVASDREVRENHRARGAKLRGVKRL